MAVLVTSVLETAVLVTAVLVTTVLVTAVLVTAVLVTTEFFKCGPNPASFHYFRPFHDTMTDV